MIPLNKPGNIEQLSCDDNFARAIAAEYQTWLFTAGDGLCLIYRYLYGQFGSLRVAVSPLTCYHAIWPVVMNGHIPVLVDIDAATLNMNPNLIPNEVDAIEVIHLGGNPVDMDAIMAKGKIVVEDCAQAMGAKWKDRYVGTWGEYGVFSIQKNLYQPAGLLVSRKKMESEILPNSSVGGAVHLYKIVKNYLETRVSYFPSMTNFLYSALLRMRDKDGGFENIVRSCTTGDNLWKFNNSLHYLEALNAKREESAKRIIASIDQTLYAIQQVPQGGNRIWNRILLRSFNRPACEVIKSLRKAGIAANNLTQSYIRPWQEPIWNESRLSAYYDKNKLKVYNEIFNQVVALPNSPFLTEQEINHIKTIISRLL